MRTRTSAQCRRRDARHAWRALKTLLTGRWSLTILTALTLAATATPSVAAQLSLTNSPLFLSAPVKNHIMLIVDNSGSMDFEVLFDTNDGALWWHTGNKSFVGLNADDAAAAGTINFNKAGGSSSTWKKYTYLFPNGQSSTDQDKTGKRFYSDATNDHFAIPPLPQYAWARSPDFNKAHFNPSVTYENWISYGTTTFTNADAANARTDPVYPATGASKSDATIFDLTAAVALTSSNQTFRMQLGMVIPTDTWYFDKPNAKWVQASSDISVPKEDDYGIQYFPATFYLKDPASLPAGFGYSATPSKDATAPDGTTVLYGYEIKPGNFSSTAAYDTAIQNFANWFSYYRKRHLATRAGMGHAFFGLGNVRTGIIPINVAPSGGTPTTAVTSYDLSAAADTDKFYEKLYQNTGSHGGTPNRQALDFAGKQYQRKVSDVGAPIQEACQQNFSLLFTDGFTTVNTSSGVGNVDDDADAHSPPWSGVAPYTDSFSNTLADIAMHYYKTNLNSDFPTGRVPDSNQDRNKDLHMVTFGVGLGLKGRIFGTTHFDVQDALDTTPTWQDPSTSRDPVQVDDLYHAATNGRGEILNAATPADVRNTIKDTLDKIADREASAAAVAVNSRTLNTNTRVFQARFNSKDWSGDLKAFVLTDTGLGEEKWSAMQELIKLAPASRTIFTRFNKQALPGCAADPATTTEGGVAFDWTELSTAQQCALNLEPGSTTTSDSLGTDRVAYLRGDHTNEGNAAGDFRPRNNLYKLGDLVDSTPIFVGSPPALPDLESVPHSSFRVAHANRTQMVYAGSNDGMLHGFDAQTGVEKIAYVPSMLYPNLNLLTSQTYSHRFYVDGSPTVADAYGNFANGCSSTACWRTVLVGGFAGGGKGYFAIDVTDPAGEYTDSTNAERTTTGLKFAEANASKLALWEFTDSGSNQMGYSFGKASVVKVRNGTNSYTWAAIFGNGYNSKEERAYLYVIDVVTGTALAKILLPDPDTTVDNNYGTPTNGGLPTTPYGNGLSDPAVADKDQDFVADYVYAGDLRGNMWKIDLTSTDPANWGSFHKKSGRPVPLYTAKDGTTNLPITQRPEVGLHPDGKSGLMVYFGTGRYLSTTDNVPSASPIHAFHGLWDEDTTASQSVSGNAAVAGDRLRLQTLTETGNDRTVTNNAIKGWGGNKNDCNTETGPNAATGCMGWITKLLSSATASKGEMSVTNPVLLGGTVPRVLFTTLIPSQDNCEFGGDAWLMELNPKNGGQLARGVFDVNGDGKIDDNDKVGDIFTSGMKLGIGIASAPVVVTDSSNPDNVKDLKTISGTTGNVKTVKNYVGKAPAGRQSWRQLK